MKLFHAFATVALVVSASSGTALAQDADAMPPKEPIPVKRVEPKRVFEPERAEQVFEDYAECIVAKERRLGGSLKKYLRVPDGSRIPPGVVKKLVDPDCLNRGTGRMWMSPSLFGQALYSALYRREFGNSEPTGFVPAVSYDSEFEPEYLPLSNRQVALRQVGDCAASQDFLLAHRFAVAEVRSKRETALLSEIVQSLSHCIRSGEQVEFTRPMLKGILAESLYKFRHGMTQTQVASAQ